jgi:hypothetical protein
VADFSGSRCRKQHLKRIRRLYPNKLKRFLVGLKENIELGKTKRGSAWCCLILAGHVTVCNEKAPGIRVLIPYHTSFIGMLL